MQCQLPERRGEAAIALEAVRWPELAKVAILGEIAAEAVGDARLPQTPEYGQTRRTITRRIKIGQVFKMRKITDLKSGCVDSFMRRCCVENRINTKIENRIIDTGA